MSRRARTVLALVALAGLALTAGWAVTGLHAVGKPAGEQARGAPRVLIDARHVDNAVTGITYDVRGTDTLGEELILFVAALGVALLLRATRGEHDPRDAARAHDERRLELSGALRATGAALVAPVFVVGLYVITHGQLGPGGGFQGGVILAAGLLVAYAAGQVVSTRVGPLALLEVTEATGALAFVLVALGGLVFSVALLANFRPLARTGSFLSGGTVPVLSAATGVEVTGALALILSEFLDQALLRPRA